MSRWALTSEALESLLDFLGPDREAAGRSYQRIRRKLERIFEWRGCAHPEELVDETMNRVAHKLAAGLEVRAEEPFNYFCGVAQMVFKELLRREGKRRAALAEIRRQSPADDRGEATDDERLASLHRCLAELSDRHRELILRYHTGDGRVRIEQRQRLAEDLGLPINALRIRAHRVRGKLEECIRARLGIC